MTFADLTPEEHAQVCRRINSLLQRVGPSYLATVARAICSDHAFTASALVAMMSRGAVVCEPVRNGEKYPRYRAVTR